MSDYSDFVSWALPEATNIIGAVQFTVAGMVGIFTGTIDEFGSAQELRPDGGGFALEQNLTIVADRSQFLTIPKLDSVFTISGKTRRLDRLEDDEIKSVTFHLAAVHPK